MNCSLLQNVGPTTRARISTRQAQNSSFFPFFRRLVQEVIIIISRAQKSNTKNQNLIMRTFISYFFLSYWTVLHIIIPLCQGFSIIHSFFPVNPLKIILFIYLLIYFPTEDLNVISNSLLH